MILDGKRILITGGTGSLGKVLVRRILSGELGNPQKLIVFSRDEAKQHFMRLDYLQKAGVKDLPSEMVKKTTDALVAFMQTDLGKRTFYDLYGVTAFRPTSDSNYDGVREMLKKLGKSAAELTQ